MKKTILGIVVLVVILALATTVNAAATLTLSAETIKTGETVVVTFNPGELTKGVQFDLTYDNTVLEYVSASSNAVASAKDGKVTVMVVDFTDTAVDMTTTLTFKALKDGNTAIALDDVIVGDKEDVEVAPAKVVVGEVTTEPVENNTTNNTVVENNTTVENGTTTNTTTNTATNTTKPTKLPQTGINVVAYAALAVILVAAVVAVRKRS